MQRKLASLAWFVCGSCLFASAACSRGSDQAGSGASERARVDVHAEPAAQALAGPTTVTLTAIADTHIAQTSPTFNYGTATALPVTGAALSSWEASLIKFDAAALQSALASGTLQSARMDLNVSSTSLGFGNSQVNVHRMLVPWTEAGATWLCANDTSTSGLGLLINNCAAADRWGIEWWSLLPRPYAASPLATASVPFGQQGVVSVDVTQDLNSLAGASHQGFFLTAAAGFSSVWIRFSSRQSSTPPKLVLTIAPACTATGPDNNCNGVDDNCNGTIDEGYVSTSTSCGTGACARTGATSCVSGVIRDSCAAGMPAASDATCNGVDENCNGQKDEGYVGTPTSCGVGACANAGTTVCSQGAVGSNCTPKAPLSSDDKTCDGIDDNCSGQADEGYVAVATGCGVGACGNMGMSTCVAGMVNANCLPKSPLSSTDATCNGVDDNCNGQSDESYVSTATTCGVGACVRSGMSMCVAGMEAPGCIPAQPAASDATCDADDDNCNGQIDEGYVATQTSCEAAGCLKHGHLSCLAGREVNDCETSGTCYAESNCSDGTDNDADGHSDCTDSDCAGKANCVVEVCDNGLDDDSDGDFDCADTDCASFAVCNDVPSAPASVAPALSLTVATAYSSSLGFLYTGTSPVQKGVAPGSIAANRSSLVTGLVTDTELHPLPAVRIAILNHPELGWTNTRADGHFDIVVNAGGFLTVTMSLPGYLSAQRQIETEWNQPTRLPAVLLTQLDPVASNIDLSGMGGMQAARGRPAIDADGVRTGTLLFPSGVQATLIGADGTPISNQTQVAVRITEYTVGSNGAQRMPAELPPNSTYTYAMDLSADGLRSAQFTKPLPYYLENFLGFPTGTSLPFGFYDPNLGRWIAQDSGVVVKFLGLTGTAADLDVTGDNVADDAMTLARYGITAEEQAFLPSLYSAGASLWRVQVTHFSSYDINQGIVPDPNAQFPNASANAPPAPPGHNPPCSASGSRIACQTQSLGEDIPLPGTPYALHYNSELMPGRNNSVQVKLGTADRLNAAALELVTAEFTPKYGPMTRYAFCKGQIPNSVSWKWSGLDDYGRPVSGSTPVQITIRYFYRSYLGDASRFGYNGDGKISTDQNFRRGSGEALVALLCGQPGGGGGVSLSAAGASAAAAIGPMPMVAGYVSLRQDLTATLNSFDPLQDGVGGFTITPHHSYDPEGHTLTMGDGTRFEAQSMPRVAYRKFTFPFPPTSKVNSRVKMAALPDGTLYMRTRVPSGAGGIGRLSPTNEFSAYASSTGLNSPSCSPSFSQNTSATFFEGMRVESAPFCDMPSFALGPEGEAYIVHPASRAIFKVDKQGIVHVFAGNGQPVGGALDGSMANASTIGIPSDVEVGPDGKVYFTTSGSVAPAQIRFVDTDGRLGTLAGRASNDPLPPSQTRARQFVFDSTLNTLSVQPDGTVIFCEMFRRVGRVNVDGSISVYSNVTGPVDITNAQPGYVQFVDNDGTNYLFPLAGGARVPLVSKSGTCSDFSSAICPARSDGTIAASTGFNFLNGGVRVSPEHTYVHDRFNIYDITSQSAARTDVLTVPSPDASQLFLFDYTGRHLETRSALTNATVATFGYDAAGRLSSVTNDAGKVTQIIRDSSGTPTVVVAPFGQRTELGTNSAGLLSQIQPDPTHPPYTFSYVDDKGLLQSMTDPRGGVHTFTFEDGRLISDQAPDGRVVTLARTDASDVTTVDVSETEGGTKSFVTDLSQSGKLISKVTFPDGSRNQATETADGVTTMLLADGSTVVNTDAGDPVYGTFAPVSSTTVATPGGLSRVESTTVAVTPSAGAQSPFDWTQRVTTVKVNNRTTVSTFVRSTRTETRVTPVGRAFTTVFDTRGRLVQETSPGRAAMMFDFDTAGRLAQVTQGTRSRQFAFDPQTGFLLSVSVPALNEVTSYVRDEVGRPLQSIAPDTQVTGFGYDEVGKLLELTPPGRAAHLLGYTPADLLSSYTAPSATQGAMPSVTQFGYTKHRQSKLIMRADGRTIQSTYRSDGKLATIVSPRGTSSFTYDPSTGLMTGISDVDGGALAFTYDGSLQTGITWSGSGRPDGTIATTFDNNYWPDLLRVNGATVADYGYDNDGLVLSTGAMTITRNTQTGDITGTTLDNISTLESTNSYSELDDFSASQSMNTLYREQVSARDAAGRVTERIETIAGVATTYAYSYDAAGRLINVKINGVQSAHYDYDPNGNRSARTTSAGSDNGIYDGQDRLSSYGSATYSYVASGELATKTTSSGITTYDYDVFGNLRGAALPGGRTITYEIDANQRRIGKRIDGTRQYGLLYQSQLAPVAMLDAANAVIATFVYATRVNVPDYMIKSGQRYRIVSDTRGSVRLVIRSSDGSIAQRLDYDEYGNVLLDTNPGFQPFGFAGGIYDPDTGLVHFGLRDYDAVTGRWTSKDPVLFDGDGPNLFAYVLNDPINRVDLTGEGFLDCGKAIADYVQCKSGDDRSADSREKEMDECGGGDAGHKKAKKQKENRCERTKQTMIRACKDPAVYGPFLLLGAVAAVAAVVTGTAEAAAVAGGALAL